MRTARLGAYLGAVVHRIRRSLRRIAHPATASAPSVADRFLSQRGPRRRGAGRGLHGEAYRGHIFWDELFIFPVLNLRLPDGHPVAAGVPVPAADQARRAAKLAGYDGAMFPWQSGSDGREESPAAASQSAIGPVESGSQPRAHHIGIAIAYNVWQYYQVTGDLAYLIDHGAEMLVEIARFGSAERHTTRSRPLQHPRRHRAR